MIITGTVQFSILVSVLMTRSGVYCKKPTEKISSHLNLLSMTVSQYLVSPNH